MSSSPEERRDHCINFHKFPHDFRFDKVASKKKSLQNERMDTTETNMNPPPPPSTVKPKLTNFHFGHKSQKAFKHSSKKANPLESMNVDLKESLPEV